MTQQDRDDILLRGPAPAFNAPEALARFRERARREAIVPRASWSSALAARLSLAAPGLLRPATVLVGVLVLVFAATATGVADTILTVFEPKQVATVRVDPADLRGVPDPSEYGTFTWVTRPVESDVADADAAAVTLGSRPLVPAALPPGVPATGTFRAISQGTATFQFDEAKAREAAARVNATIPPMPAAIASTTLTMTGGPVVMQRYGEITIVQAKAPVVTSNGASVQELRDYALAQPGIPPSVAAQVRAIGDPVRTMLIPVGVDMDDARQVTVRGNQGYLVGDNTGLGSGIVWLEGGNVFGVMGPLKEADLLAVVASLR